MQSGLDGDFLFELSEARVEIQGTSALLNERPNWLTCGCPPAGTFLFHDALDC
jgi:hypothetical protein